MFEEFLENIAQRNALREVNTYGKLLAGCGAILLCLLSQGYIAPLFIALVLTAALLFLARIEAKTVTGVFLVPLGFAFMSVAGIILIAGGEGVFWSWKPLSWISLSITRDSVNQGFFVFCRMVGGMAALSFIALTTPMTDIFVIMRQCRIPEEVLDLSMIIYRTTFIIIDQVVQIYHAQVMRLGYSTTRESVRSFATMCGAAFISSWDAGDDLIRAMEARCYAGKFAVLGENRPIGRNSLAVILFFLAISSVVVIATPHITLI
jgi:cobalt/nickel transport system permease protein